MIWPEQSFPTHYLFFFVLRSLSYILTGCFQSYLVSVLIHIRSLCDLLPCGLLCLILTCISIQFPQSMRFSQEIVGQWGRNISGHNENVPTFPTTSFKPQPTFIQLAYTSTQIFNSTSVLNPRSLVHCVYLHYHG
jgi:hypothetical protein